MVLRTHGIPRAVEWVILLLLLVIVATPPSVETRKGKKSKEVVEETGREKMWITGNTTHPVFPQSASASMVVKIGSFNLKQFGTKKSKNEQVLKIIAKIVSRYDLVALQEITDVKENSIKKLMGEISHESSHPRHYVVSPRVGRTKQKEQYGLIFRPDIFHVQRQIVFDDSASGDPFSREPQIAEISLKHTGERIVFINMHVAPRNASTEIDSLTDVHSWVEDKWRIGNIVLLGDLNAACEYIRKKDIPKIRLLNNPAKYKWLISNSIDTTVGNTNCAYDRIIVSGPYLARNVVPNSAGVFEFDREYGLEQKAALNVSDHYPVEFSMHVGGNGNGEANDEPYRVQSSADTIFHRPSFRVYASALVVMCNMLSRLTTDD